MDLFSGAFGLTWYVAWHMMAYEKPSKHTRIKEDERVYIENSISENTSLISNKVRTPSARTRRSSRTR